jgi:hypothetical protein
VNGEPATLAFGTERMLDVFGLSHFVILSTFNIRYSDFVILALVRVISAVRGSLLLAILFLTTNAHEQTRILSSSLDTDLGQRGWGGHIEARNVTEN